MYDEIQIKLSKLVQVFTEVTVKINATTSNLLFTFYIHNDPQQYNKNWHFNGLIYISVYLKIHHPALVAILIVRYLLFQELFSYST